MFVVTILPFCTSAGKLSPGVVPVVLRLAAGNPCGQLARCRVAPLFAVTAEYPLRFPVSFVPRQLHPHMTAQAGADKMPAAVPLPTGLRQRTVLRLVLIAQCVVMVTSFVLPDCFAVGVICGLHFFSDTPARVIAPSDAAGVIPHFSRLTRICVPVVLCPGVTLRTGAVQPDKLSCVVVLIMVGDVPVLTKYQLTCNIIAPALCSAVKRHLLRQPVHFVIAEPVRTPVLVGQAGKPPGRVVMVFPHQRTLAGFGEMPPFVTGQVLFTAVRENHRDKVTRTVVAVAGGPSFSISAADPVAARVVFVRKVAAFLAADFSQVTPR
ncbi:hypothetical protein, partial [Citrobacter farmeri]